MEPGSPNDPPGGGGYGGPPGGNYGAAPGGAPAQPPGAPAGGSYGSPPPAAPQPGGNYGAPPAGGNYGSPPPNNPGVYGGPPPGGGPPQWGGPTGAGGHVDLSFSSLWSVGWDAFKENLGAFVIAGALFFSLYTIAGGVQAGVNVLVARGDLPPLAQPLTQLTSRVVVGLVQAFLSVGGWRMCLAAVRKQQVSAGMLFSGLDQGLWKWLQDFAYGMAVGIGTLLCFFPGMYFAIRLQFGGAFLADKRMGPIDSLQASWNTTEGRTMDIFLVGLLIGLINLAAFLALCFPVFITAPVGVLATAEMYNRLAGGDTESTANVF